MRRILLCFALPLLFSCAAPSTSEQAPGVVRTDHYVAIRKSIAPACSAATRRSMSARSPRRAQARFPAPRRVVLVHGAGTPAEVSFDVPYGDYSWMAYLANAGFDVFAMDMIGYGRSTRPPAMADACNFPKAQQAQFRRDPRAMRALASDRHHDDGIGLGRHRRGRRSPARAARRGSSGTRGMVPRRSAHGGLRADPRRSRATLLLAPAYAREQQATAPDPSVTADGQMGAQSSADFTKNWDRQVGCANQYDAATSESICKDMLASDPVASKWGPAYAARPT